MVIEQVDRAVLVSLGSKSEIAENLRLGKLREKQNKLKSIVFYRSSSMDIIKESILIFELHNFH